MRAAPFHAEMVAKTMRAADVREVYATAMVDPLTACRLSLAATPDAKVVFLGGELAGLFGITPLSLFIPMGTPWYLGTDVCDRRRKLFLKHSSPIFRREAARFRYLENRVDVRNRASIRWLRWLGFTIHDPEPWGPMGLPFHKFTMGAL